MQYRNLGVVAMVGGAMAAYVPSEPWSTLTPSVTLSGGATDFSGSFGIAIKQIATSTVVSSSASASATLDVKEHKDRKAAEVTQIGDGQIQAATSTSYGTTVVSAAAITQIGDGQIQAATSTVAPSTITTATKVFVSDVITQIGDGQIQAATSTAKFIDNLVTQIGDGQIQATTATTSSSTAELVSNVVTQIGDGQIQATTATTATGTTKTTDAATQIGDGQVQATTASGTTATESAATQIGDGQVQQSSAVASSTPSSGITLEACASDGTLSMKLHDGILTDSKGRIGSIVANQQFQFDGPPPQAGAIYAAGWSISPEGKLAIGNTTTFYECLSGDFYNLYHKEIGSKCYPVELDVVELVSC